MVAMIMLRALHKDITLYNAEEEDPTEETGWKFVHGDIFRRPFASSLLSVTAGSGVQVVGVAVVTLIFSALGFVSPANRGSIITIMLLFFCFYGSFCWILFFMTL